MSTLDGDFGGTFPYRSGFAEADGVRLAYVDEGPCEAPPVLFLHGNPTWGYVWRRPIAELTARGHRCVALDHMGFGRSDKPRRLSEYTLDRHVRNAGAVIDELDLRDVTLVMHDWGGPIGIGAMLDRLDRLRAMVVMNSWAWQLPTYLPPFLREFRTEGLGELLALGSNLLVEAIPGGMNERDTDPAMMDAYRAPFPDFWSRLGPLAFTRDIPISPRDESHAAFGLISERLREVDVPVQLIWGLRDRVFQSVFLEQWKELFPDAGLLTIEEAAHFLVEDQPEQVSEAIAAFVEGLEG